MLLLVWSSTRSQIRAAGFTRSYRGGTKISGLFCFSLPLYLFILPSLLLPSGLTTPTVASQHQPKWTVSPYLHVTCQLRATFETLEPLLSAVLSANSLPYVWASTSLSLEATKRFGPEAAEFTSMRNTESRLKKGKTTPGTSYWEIVFPVCLRLLWN